MSNRDYTTEELADLLKQDLAEGESWHIEFKEYKHDQLAAKVDDWKRDLAHELAALGSVGGKVYVGVSDDGVVTGLGGGSHQDWQEGLFERATGKVEPKANWHSYPFKDPASGCDLIMIELVEGEPIYYVDGKPYIREGTKSRPAKPEEVKARFKEYFERTQAVVTTENKEQDKKTQEQSEVASWITDTIMNLLVTMNLFEQKEVNPQLDQLKLELGVIHDAIDKQLGKIKRAFGMESDYYKKMELISSEILGAHNVQFLIDGGRSWNEWLEHLRKVHRTATELLAGIRSSTNVTIAGLDEQEEDALDGTLRWLNSIDDTLSKFIYESGHYVRVMLRLHFLLWLSRSDERATPYKDLADHIEQLSWARSNTDYMEIEQALPELKQKVNALKADNLRRAVIEN